MASNLVELEYEKYKALDGINFSMLKHYLDCPARFKFEYDRWKNHEQEDKEQFILGRALHHLTLQPDMFKKLYARLDTDKRPHPDKNYQNGDNRKWLADMKAEIGASGRITLTTEFWNDVHGMAKSLNANRVVRNILATSKLESTIAWKDEESGVWCKGMADIDNAKNRHPYTCDLKSVLDASYLGFRKSLEKYKYYMQLPMYSDGLRANDGIERVSNYFICVEKTAPYFCAVYELDVLTKDWGRRTYKALLLKHRECVEKNEWGGYEIFSDNEQGILNMQLSSWEIDKLEKHKILIQFANEI